MSHRVVFLVPFVAAACGAPIDSTGITPRYVPHVNQSMPTLPHDDEVEMIAHEFYADAQALGVEVDKNVQSITFVDSYGKCSQVVGQCEYYGDNEYKAVTILKSAWERGTPQFKKTLLYHELGHCALNLDHTAGTETAIMNPHVLSDYEAASTWFDLVVELFFSAPSLGLDDESGDEEDECGK